MLRLPLADFDIDVAQSPFLPRVPRATVVLMMMVMTKTMTTTKMRTMVVTISMSPYL